MFFNKQNSLLKRAFTAFREGCIGQQSQRAMREQRKLLVESIRQELQDKNVSSGDPYGIVLEEEVRRLTYRKIVTKFLEKKQLETRQKLFAALKQNTKMVRNEEKRPKQYWFKKRAGICFYAWSDYIYLVGQGLQRKRWPGPRKYEVRYNQKRIDHFTRTRLLRYAFYPLKHLVEIEFKGRKAYKKYATKLLSDIVREWRVVAARDHAIRKDTISRWKHYSLLIASGPFAAWKSYLKKIKNRDLEHNSMLTAYLRWKWKQKLYTIMKTWFAFLYYIINESFMI